MRGFLEEIDSADLNTNPPILGDWTADFGYMAGLELLRTRDFSAIFAANDHMALGLMHAFREAGLSIPRDVSVVGFDDIAAAAWVEPSLTTVVQQKGTMGRLAVERLAEAIGSVDVAAPEVVRLPVRIEQRRSSGPPRAAPAPMRFSDSHARTDL